MTVHRVAVLAAMLALTGQTGLARAIEAAGDSPGAALRRIRTHAAPHPEAAGHLMSDFIKGSPAQQELERRDNDLATMRPVDHRKDEFFSDWRGLR